MKLENNCEDFHRNLQKLLQADRYCDIILISGDGKTRIPAHRVVLAASSPYFANQTLDGNGNAIKELTLTAINGATLQTLVNVCYYGILDVNIDNMSNLYMGAVHLQLNSIIATMENYIATQLNIANCLHFYNITSQSLSRSLLYGASRNYIRNHFVQITCQPSFLELDFQKLKGLLELKDLIITSAEDLFHNVMKWIQHDPERNPERQQVDVLSELLPNLRLYSMSPTFLLGQVKPHCKTFEMLELVIAAVETQLEFISLIPIDVKRPRLSVDAGYEHLIVVASKGAFERSAIMEYSFERQDWIILAELPTKIHNFSVTLSKAMNSLCFIGGYLDNKPVRDVLLWNLKTRIFMKSTSMIAPRSFPGVTSLNDGDLIIVGGWIKDLKDLSTVERWLRKSGDWHSLVPTKEGKCNARLITIDNLVYCIGGYNDGCLKSVDCYNLIEKCWSTLAPLNHARCKFGTLFDGEKLYVIGGGSNAIEYYDPERDRWTQVCTVMCSKSVQTCVRHNNRLFAFGKGVVFVSDGNYMKWKRSVTIEAINTNIYGAFSIPLQ